MSGHTPGPWFVDADGKVWRRDPRDLYENGGGVAGDHPVATVHRGWPRWEDGFPVEANARLIAAAPELLGACKAQADELKALREWVAETYGQTKAAPVTGAAVAEQLGRAAIAKATGGSA